MKLELTICIFRNTASMSQLPATRQSLLIRLQRQSSDAWSEFLEIYEQAILNYARSRGLQDADAQDVTQEVLAAVTLKVDTWDSQRVQGTFRGWLFRVARNIAVDRISRQSKHAVASGDSRVAEMLSQAPLEPDAESDAFRAEYRRKVFHWAAEKIRPEVKESSWQSFWLTTVEGLKAEEVAEQLGMTAGSVYGAKFRIVSRLREIVARFDELGETEEIILSQIRKDS